MPRSALDHYYSPLPVFEYILQRTWEVGLEVAILERVCNLVVQKNSERLGVKGISFETAVLRGGIA